ncbi:putative 2-deoxy-D-gluconate 3-dehydrogenase [Calycina marina]|uniref:2-deoxy-D-gluconate 3-dehydrogenase n=1 Tax=Calycina marina TaxID=1763456 RepID=A0A9P7ZC69_9HELO|nr:putative 2-deoxy-D-gluconate 3-dehydrogenase [Calycina marina]
MEQYLSNMFGLKGKTVLITGGYRGIGRALSVALAAAGAHIILTIDSVGGEYRFYAYDLSSREQILRIVPDMIAYKHDVDIFVHCAGLQHRSPAEGFTDEAWDTLMNVNLTAGFQISRDMENTGLAQKIVFIASILSFMGGFETPAYTATKGAVGQLTKALNNEWMAKGVIVNAIAPGYIETDLTKALRDHGEKEKVILQRTPISRWGEPKDLAGSIVHLCSKASDYVGGEIHVVDGGYLGR